VLPRPCRAPGLCLNGAVGPRRRPGAGRGRGGALIGCSVRPSRQRRQASRGAGSEACRPTHSGKIRHRLRCCSATPAPGQLRLAAAFGTRPRCRPRHPSTATGAEHVHRAARGGRAGVESEPLEAARDPDGAAPPALGSSRREAGRCGSWRLVRPRRRSAGSWSAAVREADEVGAVSGTTRASAPVSTSEVTGTDGRMVSPQIWWMSRRGKGSGLTPRGWPRGPTLRRCVSASAPAGTAGRSRSGRRPRRLSGSRPALVRRHRLRQVSPEEPADRLALPPCSVIAAGGSGRDHSPTRAWPAACHQPTATWSRYRD
jgi:hypothetical protein